jgi:hypothetical protein
MPPPALAPPRLDRQVSMEPGGSKAVMAAVGRPHELVAGRFVAVRSSDCPGRVNGSAIGGERARGIKRCDGSVPIPDEAMPHLVGIGVESGDDSSRVDGHRRCAV